MKKVTIGILIIFFSLLSGCIQQKETAFDFIVSVGENFSITLDSNPTTGYMWEAQFDSNFIKNISREYKASPGEPMPGKGGTETFVFLALKSGETNITMKYRRSWKEEPIEEKSYSIKIR